MRGVMSLPELVQLVGDFGLLHPPLTLPRLTQFFVAANHHHTTDEAVDEGDSASQLTYSEFLGVLGRVCDCRVVAAAAQKGPRRDASILAGGLATQRRESAVARDAERPFEEVLDGWLEKELMPRAREIVPALFKLSEEGEEEELQMVQRQRLQSLSLHHRIGDRSGAAGLAATLQMMAGVGDGA